MEVRFTCRDPQADELRALAERRVRFMLRRLGWVASQADVQLSEAGSAADKRCKVELRADGLDAVAASAVARDWRTALDDALARAARRLMQLWQHRSATRRLRQRLIQQLVR